MQEEFARSSVILKKRLKQVEIMNVIAGSIKTKRLDEDSGTFQEMVDEMKENDKALSDDDEDIDNKEKLFGALDAFKDKKTKQASINFYSYEFERFIKGTRAEQLVKYLSNQSLNSPLFESPTVQAYLDSQWQ